MTMSRILILSSYYLGAATTNGICAKNLVKEFQKKGDEVYALCYDTGKVIENVYTVPCPVDKTATTFLGKLCILLRTFIKPTMNQTLVMEYRKATLQICKDKKIDTVICMFFPFETVTVIKAVKKHFPKIQTIIYELDSVGDGIASNNRFKTLRENAVKHWCHDQYRYADKVVIMQTHEEYWKKTFGKRFGDKLSIADIPVLVEKKLPLVDKQTGAPIQFLYGGLIEESYRSPEHLLKVFEIYSKLVQSELHFFSKGDCETKIDDAAKRIDGIFRHGYVPETELDIAIAQADVLLSIGNRVSRSVPSKLITYFAFGKPVVHFASQRNDVCVKYLEQYELGLVLCEWDSVEENVHKLINFVDRTRDKTLAFADVEKLFLINTPAFSVRLICNKDEY